MGSLSEKSLQGRMCKERGGTTEKIVRLIFKDKQIRNLVMILRQ